MINKKTKKLADKAGEACRGMRHVAKEIRDFYPHLAKVLDDAESQLTKEILDLFEEDSKDIFIDEFPKIENRKKKKKWIE